MGLEGTGAQGVAAAGYGERLEKALDQKGRRYTNVAFMKDLNALLDAWGIAGYKDSGIVTEWTKGRGTPPLVVIEASARILGVRFAWLATDEGPMLVPAGAEPDSSSDGRQSAPRTAGQPHHGTAAPRGSGKAREDAPAPPRRSSGGGPRRA